MHYVAMPVSEVDAVARLKRLEHALDRQFSIAGVQFGFDSVIGLVPIVGDLVSGAIGFYVISEAKRLGVSRWTKAQMYSNLGLDVAVGALPIVGDLFDVAFKSNTKNVRLLIADLEKRELRRAKKGTLPKKNAVARAHPAG